MKKILFVLCFIANITIHANTIINIDIFKFKFSPAEITINPGDTIRWTNKEKRQYHSVWFVQSDEAEPDYIFPNEFFEKTFRKIGDFHYRCGPHPRMKGIVHVVQATKDEKHIPVKIH